MIFSLVFMIFLFAIFTGLGIFLFKKIQKNIKNDEETEKYIPTTQDNLPIDYIRDGIVKMKNGNFACVVKVPSINIELMEDDEKETVFGQYKQILGSISFPFQFLQQSRVADVSEYLNKLDRIRFETKNNFIKKQLDFYREYIDELVKTKSVLTKKFFIIIPFDEYKEKKQSSNSSGSLFDFSIKPKKKEEGSKDSVIEEEKKFEIARRELLSRAGLIQRSFARFEIRPERLGDDEITELLYTSYNKNRSVYQPLMKGAVNEYSTIFVDREGRR